MSTQFCLLALLLAACGGFGAGGQEEGGDQEADIPAPTAAAVLDRAATATTAAPPPSPTAGAPAQTPTAAPPAATPSPPPTPDPPTAAAPATGVTILQNNTPVAALQEAYYLSASRVNIMEEDAVPAGSRRLLVTGTVGSSGGYPVVVTPDSLVLLGPDRTVYPPLPPRESLQPYLIAAELDLDASIYGFVLYDVPASLSSTDLQLGWCPGAAWPCENPLTAPLP